MATAPSSATTPASRNDLTPRRVGDEVLEGDVPDRSASWPGCRRGTLRPVPWLVSEARVLASAEVADDRSARRRGLLGRDALEGALVLRPCRWVHTIGMRFPIDVAYLDGDGTVIKMRRHRIGIPVWHSRLVIEAEGGAFARWGLHVGDVVEVRDDDS